MLSEDLTQLFQHQRKEFAQLHLENVIHDSRAVPPPSAKKAYDFGETLLRCPSLEAIRDYMRQHVEDARSFLIVANKVTSLTDKNSGQFPAESAQIERPFFLLGSVVLDILEESKTTQPNLWGPNE
jgi:hypothetical protein